MKDGSVKHEDHDLADMFTKEMHLYSTGGLTCSWINRGNE